MAGIKECSAAGDSGWYITDMARKHMKLDLTPEQRAEIARVREHFQKTKPTLADMSGEPMTMGEYLEKLRKERQSRGGST